MGTLSAIPETKGDKTIKAMIDKALNNTGSSGIRVGNIVQHAAS